MKTQEGIARRISQLCAERQITINRLATMSGVPSSTIKNIFQKKSNNTEELRGLEQEIEQFFLNG